MRQPPGGAEVHRGVQLAAARQVLTLRRGRRPAARLDAAWANVYDYLEDGHALEVLAFYQIPGLNIDTEGWIGTRFDYCRNSTWMQAVQERRPVIWYSDESSLAPEELAERKRWNELSSITVPLLFRDKVIGLLDVGEARLTEPLRAAPTAPVPRGAGTRRRRCQG